MQTKKTINIFFSGHRMSQKNVFKFTRSYYTTIDKRKMETNQKKLKEEQKRKIIAQQNREFFLNQIKFSVFFYIHQMI